MARSGQKEEYGEDRPYEITSPKIFPARDHTCAFTVGIASCRGTRYGRLSLSDRWNLSCSTVPVEGYFPDQRGKKGRERNGRLGHFKTRFADFAEKEGHVDGVPWGPVGFMGGGSTSCMYRGILSVDPWGQSTSSKTTMGIQSSRLPTWD